MRCKWGKLLDYNEFSDISLSNAIRIHYWITFVNCCLQFHVEVEVEHTMYMNCIACDVPATIKTSSVQQKPCYIKGHSVP